MAPGHGHSHDHLEEEEDDHDYEVREENTTFQETNKPDYETALHSDTIEVIEDENIGNILQDKDFLTIKLVQNMSNAPNYDTDSPKLSDTVNQFLLSESLNIETNSNQITNTQITITPEPFDQEFWYNLKMVLIISFIMFMASFMAGYLPLLLRLNDKWIQKFSAFGAGLLLGTAIAVIIPEGIASIYKVKHEYEEMGRELNEGFYTSLSILLGFAIMMIIDNFSGGHSHTHAAEPATPQNRSRVHSQTNSEFDASGATTYQTSDGHNQSSSVLHSSGLDCEKGKDEEENQNMLEKSEQDVFLSVVSKKDKDRDEDQLRSAISLTTKKSETTNDRSERSYCQEGRNHGYLMEKLLNTFPNFPHKHRVISQSQNSTDPNDTSINSGTVRKMSIIAPNRVSLRLQMSSAVQRVKVKFEGIGHGAEDGSTVTLGLVVHAAVDGIAVGAVTRQENMALLVFLAICAHKAPAAFGLSTILLKQKVVSVKSIIRNLMIFSLAAPIGAIITFLVLESVGRDLNMHGHSDSLLPSVALLFSAGTFLYISAVHVLPEVGGGKALGWIDLCLIWIGAGIPLLINMTHDHAHGSQGHEGHSHVMEAVGGDHGTEGGHGHAHD